MNIKESPSILPLFTESQIIRKRQGIWNEISALQTVPGEPWFLTGDFNEIVENSEKCGGPARAEGTFCAFRTFLSHNGLFDLKHSGSSLSWRGQRHSHLVQCRLDRSISNSEWTDLYPSCRSQYLKYGGSDHRPLLSFLDTTRKKGQKLFRYDRRLRDNEEVTRLVEEVWNNSSGLSVEERLSCCRKAICKWSKEFQQNSRKSLEELKSRLDKALSNPIPDETLIHELNQLLLKSYKEEEEFWKQRSRQLWLALGDSNTGYFHAVTKNRQARNRFSVIENAQGVPFYEEEQIAKVIADFYSQLFQASPTTGNQLVMEALQPRISNEQNEALIRPPTAEEIKAATFEINSDKAPGPDGFSASFFQSNWEVIGQAVVEEIQLFFSTGRMEPEVNRTFVRLIPKVTGAKKVEEYRPIALCNIYYKIISKVFAIRLKPVLGDIISENQSAFIPGRAITDNVLITHEVLQFLKTSKAKKNCTMAVKTDMSKAYDRIEWEFIYQVLTRLGFHSIWVNWIMQCVTTVSYSYLVNDSVYGNVQPSRGIR